MRSRFCVPVALLCLAAAPLPAQVVRGVVTDRASGTPLGGVVVSLEFADMPATVAALPISSVLSNPHGQFAIRAPGPGRYVITAKRIGVRRFRSPVVSLGEGETQQVDLGLEAIATSLPEVTVTGLCVRRRDQLSRVASLWDEARTAITATQISLRDQLFEASVMRYASLRDPQSLRVIREVRSAVQGLTGQPFTSVPADSLAQVGFWRNLPGDSVEYYAPDADVLASNHFLSGHCFSLAAARRDHPGLIGLAFEPVRERVLGDIRGTIWLDASSYELRVVEFQYTRLPDVPLIDRSGGEVHFTRLPNGAWIVRRWFIRMPQFGDARYGRWVRTIVRRLSEEGGDVQAAGLPAADRQASVSGVVRDSTGYPLSGVAVRVAGMQHSTETDSLGRFRFEDVPARPLWLFTEVEEYAALGLVAAAAPVLPVPGRTVTATLRALDTQAIMPLVCPDVRGRRVGGAALRLTLVDSATSSPLAGIRFVASWTATRVERAFDDANVRSVQRMTDDQGGALFCDLPTRIPLEVSLVDAAGATQHVMLITLQPDNVVQHLIRARRSR
jgi:hypothetical protein